MGRLLDFASAPRPAARVENRHRQSAPAQADKFGEVILFPGVRYERQELDLASRIGTIGRAAGPGLSDKD